VWRSGNTSGTRDGEFGKMQFSQRSIQRRRCWTNLKSWRSCRTATTCF
jgi:hypothetical protein